MAPKKRIGDILIEEGLITQDQLMAGLTEQRKSGELLGSVLFGLGFISQKDIFKALSIMDAARPAPPRQSPVPELSGEIDYLVKQSSAIFTRDSATLQKKELDGPNSPLVNLVEKILDKGIERGATDVHINPDQLKGVRVRYRVDGVLQHSMFLPDKLLTPIVSRFKILGRMDIAESRLPQDGSAEYFSRNRAIDLRISSFPVVGGENIVVRILDKTKIQIGLEYLGFLEEDIQKIHDILKLPYGIILVTGPTGSGKTTALYSFLSVINSVSRNIITLEDPIEYHLPMVRQSQVNVKAGFTFATGLRSILRQDPDVVLVGEMRDFETAELTIRAALTGHLVFSTLHTNDAVSTIARLKDMGVDPFLIATTLDTVFSQRLVRVLCQECRKPMPEDNPQYRKLCEGENGASPCVAVGCPVCENTGYKGRTVIYEIFRITPVIKSLISNNASIEEIKKHAAEGGLRSMMEIGLLKVRQGITTLDELERVTR